MMLVRGNVGGYEIHEMVVEGTAEEAAAKLEEKYGMAAQAKRQGVKYDVTTAEVPVPAIKGSDKQIAWAADNRCQVLNGMLEGTDKLHGMDLAELAGRLASFARAESARIWIDCRGMYSKYIALARSGMYR